MRSHIDDGNLWATLGDILRLVLLAIIQSQYAVYTAYINKPGVRRSESSNQQCQNYSCVPLHCVTWYLTQREIPVRKRVGIYPTPL